MTLNNWKFALGYGAFFVFMGCYNAVRSDDVGRAFGLLSAAVGVFALVQSMRAWRRQRSSTDDFQS